MHPYRLAISIYKVSRLKNSDPCLSQRDIASLLFEDAVLSCLWIWSSQDESSSSFHSRNAGKEMQCRGESQNTSQSRVAIPILPINVGHQTCCPAEDAIKGSNDAKRDSRRQMPGYRLTGDTVTTDASQDLHRTMQGER